MADFAAMIKYRPMRQRVEEAIEGLGAFHRFRDLIYAEGLAYGEEARQKSLANAHQQIAGLMAVDLAA